MNNTQLERPFSKGYWLNAVSNLKSTKKIVLASIMIALMIVINVYGVALNIEFLGRKIYFEFIPAAVCSMLVGPVLGIFAGAISDVVGFFIMPGGDAFFFGYTLSAILSSLIYALFLYRTRITVVKIILAKLLVNLIVNVCLGTLWRVMMMDAYNMYWTFFGLALLKNIILLPFEVSILYYLLKYLIPISKSAHVIDEAVPDLIKFK